MTEGGIKEQKKEGWKEGERNRKERKKGRE